MRALWDGSDLPFPTRAYLHRVRYLPVSTAGGSSDLPRKTVEPIALAGTAVRTLQEFLVTALGTRTRPATRCSSTSRRCSPASPPTRSAPSASSTRPAAVKQGDKTPGVQRQYLGCVGKIDNGIVTVHVGVARGRFQALLDADLYLPQVLGPGPRPLPGGRHPRRRALPAKWRIALDQLLRLHGNGVRFDWLTFDEGYGSKVPFLTVLSLAGQKFVAEVPVVVRRCGRGRPGSAAGRRGAHGRRTPRRGRRYRIRRQTLGRRVVAGGEPCRCGSRDRDYTLVAAVNEATAEVKYFVTNATAEPLARVLPVAFRRATIEHGFRVAKPEAGLTHYEGRQYVGLMRHLILALIVMGFVSIHTDRLRGEKPAGDDGAGVPGVERAVRGRCSAAGGGRPESVTSAR